MNINDILRKSKMNEDFQKAKSHKYFKRVRKGPKWIYYYTEAEYKASKERGTKSNPPTSRPSYRSLSGLKMRTVKSIARSFKGDMKAAKEMMGDMKDDSPYNFGGSRYSKIFTGSADTMSAKQSANISKKVKELQVELPKQFPEWDKEVKAAETKKELVKTHIDEAKGKGEELHAITKELVPQMSANELYELDIDDIKYTSKSKEIISISMHTSTWSTKVKGSVTIKGKTYTGEAHIIGNTTRV